MTDSMKHHIDTKTPLFETTLPYGSKEYLDLWVEARYLYSRNALNVEGIDKEKITETHLGEYGIFEGQLVPLDMPSLNIYKKHFNSYTSACKLLNIEPLYNKNLPEAFKNTNVSHLPILVDTREQDPLEFPKSKIEKIFVGDYLIADKKYFTNTFVDRKSESDFLGTMASGIERFERELIKAVELNCYLFVVVESNINTILFNQKRFNRKTNLEYVFHPLFLNCCFNSFIRYSLFFASISLISCTLLSMSSMAFSMNSIFCACNLCSNRICWYLVSIS